MAPNKEDFLERKILCLEKRLTLIERFVEARFSESLQEYATTTTPTLYYPRPTPPPPQPSFSRPAPASVKRKASEQVVVSSPRFSPKISKIQSKGLDVDRVKDCVIKVVRLQLPEENDANIPPSTSSKSVPSTSTSAAVKEIGGVGSRTRRSRNPVVREDFITEITPRRRKGDGLAPPATKPVEDDIDDQDLVENDNSESLPSPEVVDFVETHFDDDSPLEYQEDEEEESYFTFPGTLRPAKTDRELRASRGTTNEGGGDENEDEDQFVDESDPLDKDWSGAEDEADADDDPADDENIEQPTKRKRAPARPRLPDGTRPKRVYLSTKLETIRTDVIVVNDPNLKECHICHRHFKLELIASHMLTHTKARHLMCTFANCSKSFYTREGLRKHKVTHEPEKYGRRCRFCNKLFPRSDKALNHERSCVKKAAERGEQIDPAIIEDMKRRSKGRWNWVVPTSRKGKEEKKKRCPHCNLSLKLSLFENHVKTHDESARNWRCSLCDKTYFNKCTLVRHIASMHRKEEPSVSTRQEEENVSENGDDIMNVKTEGLETESIIDEPQYNQETSQGQDEN